MNLLVIDTETGSLDPSTGALLDIAAVELRDGEISRTFRRRILPEPGLLIEPEAVACNAYSAERWAELGAVNEVDAILDFLVFLGDVRGMTHDRARAEVRGGMVVGLTGMAAVTDTNRDTDTDTSGDTSGDTIADTCEPGDDTGNCERPTEPATTRLIWAGHNCPFDRGFVEAAVVRLAARIHRAGQGRHPADLDHLPVVDWADGRVVNRKLARAVGRAVLSLSFSHRDVDLMQLATIPHTQGVVPGRSLDDLRRALLGTAPDVHDALTDATDTARLFALFERRIQWVAA